VQELEEKLRHMLAEREIHNVLLRYCRGVDRCDAELIADCFHEDARDDHGNWLATGSDVAQHIVGLVKPGTARAMHFMGNVLIEVEGDVAFAESYILAFRAFDRDGKSYTRTRAVRFVDRFEQRSGVWRISERVVADDWNRVDEVIESQAGADEFRFSRKDKEDPVYAIRRGPIARSELERKA
jgi:hypothetical protein